MAYGSVTITQIFPHVNAMVNGKRYLAVANGYVTYLVWTVARDTGANLTKIATNDVEIDGVKPPQVYDGHNTYIEWSSIPTIAPNPTKKNGVWQFTTKFNPGSAASTTYPILDLTSREVKDYVYVKTNVGGWFFDAILNAQHSSDLTITTHPIELGSSVTDYAYMNPRKLSLSVGMSDAAKSFIPGQFSGASRSVTAWQLLQKLQSMRIPIQVYTRLGLYQNMLIASLSTTDDNTTHHGLKATVNFQELLVARVSTVKISAQPAKTTSAKKGKQQPQQVPPSILYDLEQMISG